MTIGIFVAGALVTLVVAFALAIVIWGAVMDGRVRPDGKPADTAPSKRPTRVAEFRADSPRFAPVPSRARIGLDEVEAQRMTAWYPG
jgi:hypothetical protein